MRFALSPAERRRSAVISCSVTLGGSGGLLLRWVRAARILRLAKLGRISRTLRHMIYAVALGRDELLLSLTASSMLMVGAAIALDLAEGDIQADKFGSIPRALWWSVATMTTIGYGDVCPVTPLCKVLASVTAFFSIGLSAMPMGFSTLPSDALERTRQAEASASAVAPSDEA